MRTSWLLSLLIGASTLACGGANKGPETATPTPAASAPTSVASFAKSPQSLQVDKVGGSDGSLAPDGYKDLVFTAEIDGPVTAVFVVSTNAAGVPEQTFRADTMVKDQKVPKELGEAESGKFSSGVGVFEGDKLNNQADGGMTPLGAGHHALSLYMNDTGILHAGDHVRLYVLDPAGGVIMSKVLEL